MSAMIWAPLCSVWRPLTPTMFGRDANADRVGKRQRRRQDVIEQHRQLGRVATAVKWACSPRCGGGIVGRDHQQPVPRPHKPWPAGCCARCRKCRHRQCWAGPHRFKTARSSSIFSPSVVVGDSPVVPETADRPHP